MTFEHLFHLVAGFGLFLFSLRFLSLALEQVLSKHLRRWVGRMFSTTRTTLFAGISLTSVFQSGHLALLTTMGLVHHTLISLEQGILILLGASLGNAFKALIFASNLQAYLGIIFIAVGCLMSLINRESGWKPQHLIPIFIGFYFLSLELLAAHLHLLWNYSSVIQFFSMDAGEISGQLFILSVGCLFTLALRSGSLLTFFIIQLALLGKIDFAMGGTLILGVHLGQVLPSLWHAWRLKKEAWRLAVGHTMMGVISVIITLFFFPYFMAFVDIVIPGQPIGNALPYHLAGLHIILSGFHMGWWTLLVNGLVGFLKRLFPSEEPNHVAILSPEVRNMLSNSVTLAMSELNKQISQFLHLCKQETDECFHKLSSGKRSVLISGRLEMNFELIKEANYELLLSLCRHHELDAETQEFTHNYLKRLSHGSHLFQTAQDFKTHIEKGEFNLGFHFPSALLKPFDGFQSDYNEYWLSVLLNKKGKGGGANLEEALENLEEAYFSFIQDHPELPPSYLSWLYQSMTYLHSMTHQIYWLYSHLGELKIDSSH